jgi:hypothetical protein
MASADSLKQPSTAFWLWLSANRTKIRDSAGSKNCKIVGPEAIKLWKSTSSKEKAPFEEESKRQKAVYEAFVATDAGKKALEEKKKVSKHRRQIKRQSKLRKEHNKYHKLVTKKQRECKVARNAIKKPDELKKPTAYWRYSKENLKQISKLVGGKFSDVGKKMGDMWKNLSEKQQAPYVARAKKGIADYDAYVATPDGAAVHPPRFMTGYVMESRIGYSHSQSQMGSSGRWLLDARIEPKLT